MKKNLRLLAATLLLVNVFSPEAKAQSFSWLKTQPVTYGLNVQMVRYTIAADPAGNVLQAGLLTYKANTSPGMSGDVMLRKYDRTGNPIFQHTLTGNAVVRNLAVYPNGDFLLAGAFRDSVRLDANHKLTGSATSQYFVAKYSGSGHVIWVRNISSSVTGILALTAVAVDPAGHLYLAFSAPNLNSFIKKFDASGNELQTIHQNRVRNISSIGVDAASNIYAAGSCIESNATFGGQAFSNGGTNYNFYVVKYNPTGTPRWIRKVQDITCISLEMKTGPQGSVYLAGPLNGSFTFGPHTTQGKSWSYDFFLTKLDSVGTFKWVREVPQVTAADADIGYSNYLDVDAAGNAYLAGFMRNSVNWGNGIQNTGYGLADFMVQKYDTAGILMWSKNGGGPSIDEGHSVAVNSFGEVYLAGISRGPFSLDTITYTGTTSSIFSVLTKVSNPTLISGISKLKTTEQLRIFPNPATKEVFLKVPNASAKPLQITVLNAIGKVVKSLSVNPKGQEIKLNLSSFPSGLYVVRAQQEETIYQHRLVVEK